MHKAGRINKPTDNGDNQMERIPFGSEQKIEVLAPACPSCNAEHGEFHKYGCFLESCPQCGGRILKCSCLALSVMEEFKLTHEISKTLTREDVLMMDDEGAFLKSNRSYLEIAAFIWVCLNCPSHLKTEMGKRTLDAVGGKMCGDKILVDREKAAELIGVNKEETRLILNALNDEARFPEWDQHTGNKQH